MRERNKEHERRGKKVCEKEIRCERKRKTEEENDEGLREKEKKDSEGNK